MLCKHWRDLWWNCFSKRTGWKEITYAFSPLLKDITFAALTTNICIKKRTRSYLGDPVFVLMCNTHPFPSPAFWNFNLRSHWLVTTSICLSYSPPERDRRHAAFYCLSPNPLDFRRSIIELGGHPSTQRWTHILKLHSIPRDIAELFKTPSKSSMKKLIYQILRICGVSSRNLK